jgi:hypothetical protein
LRSSRELSAGSIQGRIVKAMDVFSQGEMGDDTTLIVLAIDA